ncbi:MAG: OPT/YSL family transporter [Planctomycetaceae bacterium]|nr:OPT/YSL family transporter [Planctomycetaceae bacterium]
MAIKQLTEDQIREWSVEQKDRWWLENVYRGNMPQLTLRAALTGFLLGGLLSATNLYIGAKTGWSLGVGITSVILAFAFFKALQKFGISEFTILENNAMQSIATSAGYMTSPLIASLPAYMIANQVMIPWWQIIAWNVGVSVLGVLFAFPMKRRFINDEQYPFPEGQAAGVVMDTLHSSDVSVGLFKAKVLAISAGGAGFIKFLQAECLLLWLHVASWFPRGMAEDERAKLLAEAPKKVWHLPEDLFQFLDWAKIPIPKLRGVDMRQLTIMPLADVALFGAGGLMGIRAGSSLMLGAVLNYFVLVPWMIERKEILPKVTVVDGVEQLTFGMRIITLWSLWPGVAAMVVASFVALLSKPDVFVKAFQGLTGKKQGEDVLKGIEFPLWISVIGIPLMSLVTAGMATAFFGIPLWVSLVGLPLTFVLSLVGATSTGLTSTTPIGATSKITQLFYGLVRPGDIQSNLATAGITAEVVGNSSNLLMDIKPGYMLGAKPRQQAVGHIIGILSGAFAGTFLFFVLFTKGIDPNKPETIASLQSDQFPMPSVTVWTGVAKVLTEGLSKLPQSVVLAVIIASITAFILEVLRIVTKNRFPLSPVALGLAFVLDFKSAGCMFAGSFLFWLLGVGRVKEEKSRGNLWVENHEPICAGIIAGASLMGILDILVGVFLL